MRRFSLGSLMMAVSLAAIGLVFLQSNGCSERHSRVESIQFSADDSKILVSHLSWKETSKNPDPRINATRTVSWLGLDAKNNHVVAEDLAAPTFSQRTVVADDADRVAMITDGETVTVNVGKKEKAIPFKAYNLAISNSGRYLGTAGYVYDNQQNRVVYSNPSETVCQASTADVVFHADESEFFVGHFSGYQKVDLDTGESKLIFAAFEGFERAPLVFRPDGTFYVAAPSGLSHYSAEGKRLEQVTNVPLKAVCISRDGTTLAALSSDGILIYELPSHRRLCTLDRDEETTAIALSSDGKVLAIGGAGEEIAIVETDTGNVRPSLTAGPRQMWPWWPASVMLAIWCCVAIGRWRMRRRKTTLGPVDRPVDP